MQIRLPWQDAQFPFRRSNRMNAKVVSLQSSISAIGWRYFHGGIADGKEGQEIQEGKESIFARSRGRWIEARLQAGQEQGRSDSELPEEGQTDHHGLQDRCAGWAQRQQLSLRLTSWSIIVSWSRSPGEAHPASN